jgi:signal transduction histidine kinase
MRSVSHYITTRDEMEAPNEQGEKQEYASLPVGTTALIAELLATMSHELRSPLAVIKAYTATLLHPKRSLSRAEQRAFLLTIEHASDHLEAAINHLLEMASLETGALTLESSTVNLAQLIRETISAVERRAAAEQMVAARSLRFRFVDAGSAPDDEIFIEADGNLLRQVLEQLLENASTYSPEGGTIDVSLVTLSPSTRVESLELLPQDINGLTSRIPPSHRSGLPVEQEWVEISVRDEGIGIAAEHLTRIFDPFYRVDTRLSREVNGLGIGLATCKRIVELHGGVIWAQSTPGTGSTFRVRLPRGEQRPPGLERRGLHASEEDDDPGSR